MVEGEGLQVIGTAANMRSGFVPFNALLISSVVLQQISFVIPTALLFNRRRSEEYIPPSRPLKLPNWLGWTANVIVVAMASLFTVFFVLPPFLPVTGSNMSKFERDARF